MERGEINRRMIGLHLCGISILAIQFGEQIKVLGIPFYCYLLLLNVACLIWNNGFSLCLPQSRLNSMGLFSAIWIAMATFMLPASLGTGSIMPYMYCAATALIMLVVDGHADSREALDVLFMYAAIGIIITCLFSTIELITGHHFINIKNDYYMRIGRNNAFGFQVNINDNASLLAMEIFVPLYFLKRRPVVSLILILWAVFLVVTIGSRMAIISMLCVVIVPLIFHAVSFMFNGNKHMIQWFVWTAIIVGLILVVSFGKDAFLGMITDDLNYESDAARIEYISRALQTIDEKFYIGHGAGVTLQQMGGFSIHCVLVEILCDYGLLVFLWLVYFIAKMLFAFTGPPDLPHGVYIACFTGCFVLTSFCSSSMLRIRPIWMLFALVWKLYMLENEDCLDLEAEGGC